MDLKDCACCAHHDSNPFDEPCYSCSASITKAKWKPATPEPATVGGSEESKLEAARRILENDGKCGMNCSECYLDLKDGNCALMTYIGKIYKQQAAQIKRLEKECNDAAREAFDPKMKQIIYGIRRANEAWFELMEVLF